jgi:hypothetical protein
MKLGWKEIAAQMERFNDSQTMAFRIPEIFGGGFAVVALNPLYPAKEEKKFILKVGKDKAATEQSQPYWTADKPKDLAKWIGDRLGELVN